MINKLAKCMPVGVPSTVPPPPPSGVRLRETDDDPPKAVVSRISSRPAYDRAALRNARRYDERRSMDDHLAHLVWSGRISGADVLRLQYAGSLKDFCRNGRSPWTKEKRAGIGMLYDLNGVPTEFGEAVWDAFLHRLRRDDIGSALRAAITWQMRRAA